MARSIRQSKILDIITANEIETQDELVTRLREANFDITQATISRDIKELGLIKILSSDSNKYKYAMVDASEQQASNKFLLLFKESVISVKQVNNLVVVKTLRGMANAVANIMEKFNVENSLGTTYGEDTVMSIFENMNNAKFAVEKLDNILVN